MPALPELVEVILGPVRANLRWLYRRFGRPASRAELDHEAYAVACEIIGTLREGCECARRWLPPGRPRERDFWSAVERCEREHQLTLQDLARAGLVRPQDHLARTIAGRRVEAAVHGAACDAVARHGAECYPLLTELLAAVLASTAPQRWPYISDARFWRRPTERGGWAAVGDEELPALPPGTPLKATYLGVPFEAELTERRTVRLREPGAEFDSLAQAAEAAREHVREVVRPHRPWAEWRYRGANGEAALEALRARFWGELLAPGFDPQRWAQATCHERNGRPVGLRDFFIHAAVGSMLPKVGDFGRSVMFHLVRLPDGRRLDFGRVLLCTSCGRDSDGRACRFCAAHEITPPPPAAPVARLFPEGGRVVWPAWRCCACANHWFAADARSESAETCPLCGGARSAAMITAWRPSAGVPLDHITGLAAWREQHAGDDPSA
jgi:hypothetical protein